MVDYKIIFSGPAGVGKTTAISVLSDVPVMRTGEQESKKTHIGQKQSPPAMIHGLIKLNGDSEVIHLYGISAEDHANIRWDQFTEGALGLILLLDNGRLNPFRDMHSFLGKFADVIDQTEVAIGITRMNTRPEPNIEDYHRELWSVDFNPPILEIDVKKRRDVSLLIMSLLYSIDPGLGTDLSACE